MEDVQMETIINYSLWGVYAIRFDGCDNTYVGATSCTFGHRTRGHLYSLRKNKHANKELQRLYNQLGEGKMKVFILDIAHTNKKELIRAEKWWSQKIRSRFPLINKYIGGRLKFKKKRKEYRGCELPIYYSNNPYLRDKMFPRTPLG
jgi:hypothetical protein